MVHEMTKERSHTKEKRKKKLYKMRKKLVYGGGDIFWLVFIYKKSNQTVFFFLNQNRFKPTGFGSVFLEQNPIQTGLAWFFRFDSVFYRFGSFFFGLGWVRFFRF